jgi:hypothetical protein
MTLGSLLTKPLLPPILKPRFKRLGRWVGGNPCGTIAGSLVVVIACAAGIVKMESDTSYDLWYPHKSDAYADKKYIEKYFRMDNRVERVMMVEKNKGGALTAPALKEAIEFHAILADSTYDDMCVRAFVGGPCVVHSLLSLWDFNSTILAQDRNIVSTLLGRPLTTSYGAVLDLPTVVGGRDFMGNISDASSLMSIFVLDAGITRGGADATAARAGEWEIGTFVPNCRSADLEHWHVYCMSDLSWKTENERAQDSNLYIMATAMGAMIVYVCIALGRCDAVHSKCTLATSIMGSVAMSLGVAFGLTSYAGVPFTIMSFLAGKHDSNILHPSFPSINLPPRHVPPPPPSRPLVTPLVIPSPQSRSSLSALQSLLSLVSASTTCSSYLTRSNGQTTKIRWTNAWATPWRPSAARSPSQA